MRWPFTVGKDLGDFFINICCWALLLTMDFVRCDIIINIEMCKSRLEMLFPIVFQVRRIVMQATLKLLLISFEFYSTTLKN
jgi:hypothetical protein